ncbi:MAG: Holliday junction resolvase RuvX [Chloroflexi bacterium]|nr:Holliday junction resolvase RuvX [Chloroflexota bacterium]
MIGRLLGVDHGLARLGLAVSDATGLVARELTVIHRKSRAEDFALINRIAAEQRVVAIIVGLPSNPDANPNPPSQADKVRSWVEHLAATTDLPIQFWDEQMSSHDAQILARRRKRRPKAPIDDLAARVILQSYLDALRDGLAPPPLPSHPTHPSQE